MKQLVFGSLIGVTMLDKLFVILYCSMAVYASGILYPRDSESRDVKLLNGVWQFRLEDIPGVGVSNEWYAEKMIPGGPTLSMPVPSSYNDITVDAHIRDYVGVVWYDRTFYVPKSWNGLRVWLRFSSVNYLANVWVNGQYITSHEFGSLPFQAEVTSVLKYGLNNLITVSVNNTLTDYTIPTGEVQQIETSNGTILRQRFPFRYFHYAGIDDSVCIYTTPTLYVDDITLVTDIDGSNGIVKFTVRCEGLSSFNNIVFTIRILDRTEICVAEAVKTVEDNVFSGTIEITNATLWWPFSMNPTPGYLYTFQVTVSTAMDGAEIQDTYRLKFGIRIINFTNTDLLINKQPVYMRGFGGYVDADIRGRGTDPANMYRDLYVLQWLGINAFHTVNRPLAEESLDLADQGIIIIDDCAFSTRYFNTNLLGKHKQLLTELIQRDKNRPSVIMWSIGNQLPAGEEDASYYSSLVDHIKSLDGVRPVTATLTELNLYNGNVAQYLDILGISAYHGWYTNPGVLDAIQPTVLKELQAWLQKFSKPIFMMEYGADAMPGLHIYPEWPWTEEYQISLLSQYFEVFDTVRNQSSAFIGEMIMEFTDIRTNAGVVNQAGGDKKGVATRQREPKCSAPLVRRRYYHLAHQIDGQPLPQSLEEYIAVGV